MPKIKISLNEDSINAALKELKAYHKKVKQAAAKLVKMLTEQGVEIAQLNVSDMKAVDSGELYNSIFAKYEGDAGFVVADATHAAFVEFGTGTMGKNSPHPQIAVAGWHYDVNNHGELGWWYVGRDGQYHWTKGMPSRPYMYQTAQLLRQMVVPAAKEILK